MSLLVYAGWPAMPHNLGRLRRRLHSTARNSEKKKKTNKWWNGDAGQETQMLPHFISFIISGAE